MNAGDQAGAQRVRTLAVRLAVALLLLGAGLATLLVIVVTRFGQDRGTVGTLPAILLAGAAAVVVAVVVAVRTFSRAGRPGRPEPPRSNRSAVRRKRRAIRVLAAGLVVLACALGLRWARPASELPTVRPADTGRP